MSTFGERLRSARKAAGMSQADVAGPECSVSYVSHLEAGRREPTAHVVAHLEKALGVPKGYLRAGSWAPSEADEPGGDGTAPAGSFDHLAEWVGQATEALLVRDAARALQSAERAAGLALELDQPIVWWQMTLVRIDLLADAARYTESGALAVALTEHPWVLASTSRLAQAHLSAARAARFASEPEASAAHTREALRLTEGLPPGAPARVRALMAALAIRIDPLDDYFAELETALPATSAGALRGLAAWSLGTVAFQDGRVEDGMRWHREADSMLTKDQDFRGWARFARASAACRIDAGVDEGVADLLERARHATTFLANPDEIAVLALTEAAWHAGHGRSAEARDLLAPALAAGGLPPSTRGALHLALARLDVEPRADRAAHALLAAKELTAAHRNDEALEAFALLETLS